MQYIDELLKIKYFKEVITKNLIRAGVNPGQGAVKERLDNIDKNLALYKFKKNTPGKKFDMNRFNEDMTSIHEDLKILYIILKELSVKEYEYIKAYSDAHIKELERLSANYRARSEMEISSTSLGETIFFQGSGFETFTKDAILYINLGEIKVKEGSMIAGLFHAEGIKADHVLFGFKKDSEIIYVSPHNYLQDMLRVPGEPQINTYMFKMEEDQIVRGSFKITPEKLIVNREKKYKILGAKDSISIARNGVTHIIKKEKDNSFQAHPGETVRFYIYNAKNISFRFTSSPSIKSFEGSSIEKPKRYHEIKMEFDKESAFEIDTDGEIYAIKADGLIDEEDLMFPGNTAARDFIIDEISEGKEVTYEAFAKIIDYPGRYLELASIAIKELNATEVLR